MNPVFIQVAMPMVTIIMDVAATCAARMEVKSEDFDTVERRPKIPEKNQVAEKKRDVKLLPSHRSECSKGKRSASSILRRPSAVKAMVCKQAFIAAFYQRYQVDLIWTFELNLFYGHSISWDRTISTGLFKCWPLLLFLDLQFLPFGRFVILSGEKKVGCCLDDDLGGRVNHAFVQQMASDGFARVVTDRDMEMASVGGKRAGKTDDLEMTGCFAAFCNVGKADVVVSQ